MKNFDQFWTDTLNFYAANHSSGEMSLLPDEFINIKPNSYPYSSSNFGKATRFAWIVIHKGRLDKIKLKFLVDATNSLNPVFVNEVFVIFSKLKDLKRISSSNPHLSSFLTQLSEKQDFKVSQKSEKKINPLSPQPKYFSDDIWRKALYFIQDNYKLEETVLVPNEFKPFFEKSYLYNQVSGKLSTLNWVVIHKGRVSELGFDFLNDVNQTMQPVFANEVFVIFSTNQQIQEINQLSAHFGALRRQIDSMDERIIKPREIENIAKNIEIISVHVPKTAGTSFGEYLRLIYGEEKLVTDYEELTVQKLIEQGNLTNETKIIHGHFPAHKYQGYFPNAKRIVWLRNPVIRTISWYSYCLKEPDIHPMHKEVSDSGMNLLQFAELPIVKNSMAQFIKGMDLQDFYFVGIQEFFVEDFNELALILNWSGFNIGLVNQNQSPIYEAELKKAFDSPEVIKTLLSINDQDIMIYLNALKIRSKRKKITDVNQQIKIEINKFREQLKLANKDETQIIKKQIQSLNYLEKTKYYL